MKNFIPIIMIIMIIFIEFGISSSHSSSHSQDHRAYHLARSMQDSTLVDYGEMTGIIKTRGRRGNRSSQTFSLKNIGFRDRRQSIFTAIDRDSGKATRLIIFRKSGSRPRYFLDQAPSQNLLKMGNELPHSKLMKPFSGSECWIADLGLDFFYWPKQEIITDAPIKMRKGIACEVLKSRRDHESQNDQIEIDESEIDESHSGYYEVHSWISREHKGLIYAEAFDENGKHIKTFEVANVQKIGKVWKIKKLRIRNRQTHSSTDLIFDIQARSNFER